MKLSASAFLLLLEPCTGPGVRLSRPMSSRTSQRPWQGGSRGSPALRALAVLAGRLLIPIPMIEDFFRGFVTTTTTTTTTIG